MCSLFYQDHFPSKEQTSTEAMNMMMGQTKQISTTGGGFYIWRCVCGKNYSWSRRYEFVRGFGPLGTFFLKFWLFLRIQSQDAKFLQDRLLRLTVAHKFTNDMMDFYELFVIFFWFACFKKCNFRVRMPGRQEVWEKLISSLVEYYLNQIYLQTQNFYIRHLNMRSE